MRDRHFIASERSLFGSHGQQAVHGADDPASLCQTTDASEDQENAPWARCREMWCIR
jgi:hypothetical protein